MPLRSDAKNQAPGSLHRLTEGWGSWDAVNLYLDRCQVDTPDPATYLGEDLSFSPNIGPLSDSPERSAEGAISAFESIDVA